MKKQTQKNIIILMILVALIVALIGSASAFEVSLIRNSEHVNYVPNDIPFYSSTNLNSNENLTLSYLNFSVYDFYGKKNLSCYFYPNSTEMTNCSAFQIQRLDNNTGIYQSIQSNFTLELTNQSYFNITNETDLNITYYNDSSGFYTNQSYNQTFDNSTYIGYFFQGEINLSWNITINHDFLQIYEHRYHPYLSFIDSSNNVSTSSEDFNWINVNPSFRYWNTTEPYDGVFTPPTPTSSGGGSSGGGGGSYSPPRKLKVIIPNRTEISEEPIINQIETPALEEIPKQEGRQKSFSINSIIMLISSVVTILFLTGLTTIFIKKRNDKQQLKN